MTAIPSGSVTFLFTDVEGSTRLWENHPREMRASLARHDEIVRGCVEDHRGYVFSTAGDAFSVAFWTADEALHAAMEAQRALEAADWDVPGGVRVRMGLHTGRADERGGDYFGPALNRAARLMSIGHGGQVLLSSSTAETLRDGLSHDVSLRDMGQHRLKDLARPESVWQAFAPGLQSDFPPLRSATIAIGNLSAPRGGLIGRKDDLLGVEERLADSHLVTIVGPGGVGKTRLALEVGERLRAEFPGGVWLVELNQIRDDPLVVETVAALFGARSLPGMPLDFSLAELLRRDEVLIVFDNCEHVLDGAVGLIDLLLSRCPGLRALATSRQPLGLPSETRWNLRPLPVGDVLAPGEAIELFARRAQAARLSFEVHPENRPAVVELCRRLDGLPLAIELAAARISALTPQSLLDRLDQRFSLLTRSAGGRTSHQHTLRATIDWSHDLLSSEEQMAFRRCAVFTGRFDLVAAEEVLTDEGLHAETVTALCLSLVDKSLLETVDDGEELRYFLLETIREYALERLMAAEELPQAQRRHSECFARRVAEFGAGLSGPDQVRSQRRLDADLADVGAAVRRTADQGDKALAISLVAPLADGILALRADETILARPVVEMGLTNVDAPRLDELVAVSLYDAFLNSDPVSAAALEDSFLNLLEGSSAPPCHTARALVSTLRGDVAAGIALNYRCAETARRAGNEAWMGAALVGLAACEWFISDPQTLQHASDAVELTRRSGSPTWHAAALLQVARGRMLIGDMQVRELLEEAIDVAGELGYVLPVPYAHAHLGEFFLRDGDYAHGLDHFREAIVNLYRARDIADVGFCLTQFAQALLLLGRSDDAVYLYEAVKQVAPHWLGLPVNARMISVLESAAGSLPADRLGEVLRAARAYQLDGLVDYALTLCDEG